MTSSNGLSDIIVQLEEGLKREGIPETQEFVTWVHAVFEKLDKDFGRNSGEVSISIVSETESQNLNREYRGKDKPTNVLSFPLADESLPESLLGDLVICASVVEQEAIEQKKLLKSHWMHMVVHGILHLFGFDHIDDDDAEEMEQLEINILQNLGVANPY